MIEGSREAAQMEIESYRFGEIVVGGETYVSDVIIGPGLIKPGWWRLEGHRLALYDLRAILDMKPEVLVIGTGYFGRMEVPAELIESLKEKGIELLACDSREACRVYNSVSREKVAVAALHLTC